MCGLFILAVVMSIRKARDDEEAGVTPLTYSVAVQNRLFKDE